MQSHLADIDELVLRCRDDEARQYIAEAVASYKAGAFRACIVMTWIAVLYDFLYKLRELELAGDKQAKVKLEEFEKARTSKDYNKSLEFERGVLKSANEEFEFISDIECEELQRLHEDRNRCAHPSMTSADEIYSPTSELTRYHLRNAVGYMLQYPPTQGKTFIDSILKDTQSAYFPINIDDAVIHLGSKRLERTKETVVRNIATALLKGLLVENFDEAQFERTSTALLALRRLRRDEVETVLKEHISKLISHLEDKRVYRAFNLLNYIDDIYEFLSDDVRIRLQTYLDSVEKVDELAYAIHVSLDIPELRATAMNVLKEDEISPSTLSELVRHKPRPEYVERALELYKEIETFDNANTMAQGVLIPLVEDDCLNKENIKQLFAIGESNSQVIGSYDYKVILKLVLEKDALSNSELESLLSDHFFLARTLKQVFLPYTLVDDDE